jgi:type II secretory pathway pseudopilin PulG
MQRFNECKNLDVRDSALRWRSGFALIATLLALLILSAMGMLVFAISTQDIRISTRAVGEKKALAAAEAGIHRLNQNFDPNNLSASAVSNIQVNPANDPTSRYTIEAPALPGKGPSLVPLAGYSIGGGQQWRLARYVARVMGTNTRYGSNVQIDTSLGFGPVETTTTYR